MVRIIQFVAVMLTAFALIPGGAHFLALWNKIRLPADDYLIVQSIYRGWALLGVIWILAIAGNLAAAILARTETAPFVFSLLAVGALVGALIVFFIWTEPANAATGNWTAAPANFETLRRQWEFSHAANAGLTFAALAASVLAGFVWRGATTSPA
jgi:hypothetical protein